MFLCKRSQRGLKPVQPTLNVHGGCPVIAEASPFRTGGHVRRWLQPKMTGEAAQIVRFPKRSSDTLTVTVKVEVRKEEPEPLDESGQTNVAGLTHLFHGPMQMLESTVKVARSVRDTTFRHSNGRMVEEGEVLFGQFWKIPFAHRFDNGFRKTFQKLRGLGR